MKSSRVDTRIVVGDEVRRRAYLIGLAIGVPTVPVMWLLRQHTDPGVRWGYPVMALLLGALWWALARRRVTVVRAERQVLALVATLALGRLSVQLFGTPDLATARLQVAETTFANLHLLFVFAFLAYETARALRISIALYCVIAGLIGSRLLPAAATGADPDIAVTFMRLLVGLAAGIVLLFVLAHAKEEVADARARTAALERMAFADALTGLPNRRALRDALEQRMAEAARYSYALSVVAIDLDSFKQVNDQHGHASGDLVLKGVASTMAEELRGVDAFGRWGGEEFLIVALGIDAIAAQHLAERCREVLADSCARTAPAVTASFGVASHRAGDTIETLLARADAALYAAKDAGRNRVMVAASG
ncbi:MAG: GGDEF domain-containing protein [Euzebyales bacterium]|nr:GGDEF domain-containing protein [Euzebyales bacterium]